MRRSLLLGDGRDEHLDLLGDPLGDRLLHVVRALDLLEAAGGEALDVLVEFFEHGLLPARGSFPALAQGGRQQVGQGDLGRLARAQGIPVDVVLVDLFFVGAPIFVLDQQGYATSASKPFGGFSTRLNE